MSLFQGRKNIEMAGEKNGVDSMDLPYRFSRGEPCVGGFGLCLFIVSSSCMLGVSLYSDRNEFEEFGEPN